jgi:hypothetical protein
MPVFPSINFLFVTLLDSITPNSIRKDSKRAEKNGLILPKMPNRYRWESVITPRYQTELKRLGSSMQRAEFRPNANFTKLVWTT